MSWHKKSLLKFAPGNRKVPILLISLSFNITANFNTTMIYIKKKKPTNFINKIFATYHTYNKIYGQFLRIFVAIAYVNTSAINFMA